MSCILRDVRIRMIENLGTDPLLLKKQIHYSSYKKDEKKPLVARSELLRFQFVYHAGNMATIIRTFV